MIVLDFRRLSRGDLFAGLAGLALLVVMIAVDWFAYKSPGVLGPGGELPLRTVEGFHRNAFQSYSYIDLVLLITVVASFALVLLRASGRDLDVPIEPAIVVLALGAVSIALIAISLIDPPDLSPSGVPVSQIPGAEVTRKLGPWLGLVAAAGVTLGALTAIRTREVVTPQRGGETR